MISPRETVARAGRPFRILLAAVLALLVAAVVWQLVARRSSAPETTPPDTDVTVQRVSFDQHSTDYVVTSVEALTRGDDGYVRLHVFWPETDSDDRTIPVFGAEVSHHQPYAGVSAQCGLSAPQTVAAADAPATIDLPCTGLLVPADVDEVVLSD